jgi:hypothetical protein
MEDEIGERIWDRRKPLCVGRVYTLLPWLNRPPRRHLCLNSGVTMMPNSNKVKAQGSGTLCGEAAAGIDICQFCPISLRSPALTTPSAVKSPNCHVFGLPSQFIPSAFRSDASTVPSRLEVAPQIRFAKSVVSGRLGQPLSQVGIEGYDSRLPYSDAGMAHRMHQHGIIVRVAGNG